MCEEPRHLILSLSLRETVWEALLEILLDASSCRYSPHVHSKTLGKSQNMLDG